MIRSFKKQYGRITSIILSIALLVTGLPADLLGGIASVAAADEMALADGKGTDDGTDDGDDAGGVYVLDGADVPVFAAKAKADGETETAGTDDYFTLIYSNATKTENKNDKVWSDDPDYVPVRRINFGGGASIEKNAIKFTTKFSSAKVKVWWVAGADGRQMTILDAEGKPVATTEESSGKDKPYLNTFTLESAGTYYLGGSGANNYIFRVEVTDELPPAEYVLDGADVPVFAAKAKADGETEKAGTDDYFTLIYSNATKTENKNDKVWSDDPDYVPVRRINFGGGASIEKNAIKFTTKRTATVKVWWVAGADGRQMTILDAEGKPVATTEESSGKDKPYLNTFKLESKGTYYLGGSGANNYIFRVQVTEGSVDEPELPRAEWDTVEPPVIVKAAVDAVDASKIVVTVKGFVGHDGADSLIIDMLDAKGNLATMITDKDGNTGKATVESKAKAKAEDEQTFEFKPTASGDYTFSARLVRADEEDKGPVESEVVSFKLPLVAPQIRSVTNKGTTNGKGNLEIVWQKTPEATSYIVTVGPPESEQPAATEVFEQETTKLQMMVSGLEIGSTVQVEVVALNRNTVSPPSDLRTVLITGNNDRTWSFSAWGSSVSLSTNNYENAVFDEEGNLKSVTVKSLGGAGKIVPASTDGLAFYYTTIDPDTENFTLTATVHVDEWTYSNGQDGFGMMVSDAVGDIGDGTAFWNNSYQLVSSKIEYRWDTIDNKITNVVDLERTERYSMRLGLGWLSKEGATATDVAKIKLGTSTMPDAFVTGSGTLETSASRLGEGGKPLKGADYNIVGNNKGGLGEGTTSEIKTIGTPVTDFKLRIQRNNTGYILSYLKPNKEPVKDENGEVVKVPVKDENGEVVKDAQGNIVYETVYDYPVMDVEPKIFYDDYRNNLTQIDKKNIYVGFFAARNAKITVSDIEFETIHPDDDAAAADKVITKIDPEHRIVSSVTSNSDYYELITTGNMDGRLTMINKTTGEVLADGAEITAGKKFIAGTTLKKGVTNEFEGKFVPNPDFVPGENQEMSNLDTILLTHKVSYAVLEGENGKIYVTPDATSSGTGASNSPVDIQTAVAYARPGQTIVLAGGTYALGAKNPGDTKADTLLIDRGHSGTAKEPIYMVAADKNNRPVLDFAGQQTPDTAFTIVGDYWYLKGFDVTNSKNAQKGVQVSGDHNVLEDIHTYKNGNTGVQIARYQSDGRADWPSYNTILNCTSYLNADSGYEDADGFACKLTAGEGNKFIGCIAAYNADDGWDLFAKVESGSIGSVTIENCLAFKNGYVLTQDGTWATLGFEGKQTEAGNGNGFKMGGDSMSGYHVLKNSIAFGNRAKGIDSNSCPDNQVYNSTSFNNESYNVAFYTTSAPNTDYYAEGILSVKTNNSTGEQLKPQGTQKNSKIYGATNYYFNGTKSVNNLGEEATKDWFVNIDMATAVENWCKEMHDNHNATVISREADGTINMHGFLELKPEHQGEKYRAGAVLGSTASSDVLERREEVSVYAATVTYLSDVKLDSLDNGIDLHAEGYDWKYPNTEVAVFAGTTTEFIAVAKDKPDVTVAVNFIDVTGVEFTLDQTVDQKLIGEETLRLEAVPVLAPAVDLAQLENAQYGKTSAPTFRFEIKESSKVVQNTPAAVNEEGQSKAIGVWDVSRSSSSKDGLAKYTVTMTATINGKAVKKQATCTFTTRATDYEFKYDVDGADEVDGKITVDKDASFTLKDLKVTGVGNNETVKVTVSDTKVIRLSGTTITAIGEGTATITLTAAADKTVIKKILVKVKGTALKANVSNIIVDKAKTDGVQITVVECDDNTLGTPAESDTVRVKKVLKGKSEVAAYKPYFTVTQVINNIYMIQTTEEGANIPNGTYNLVLEGYLSSGEYAEFEPIIVKVIETKPTVAIKQKTKPNVFYKAGSASGYGNLTATSKLADVTLTQRNADESDFSLAATSSGYNVVLKRSAQSKVENRQRLNNKIVVDVTYSGYKEKYNRQGLVITVSTINKAPRLKVEVDNKVLYTQLGITDTEIRILDTDTKTYVTSADITLASSTPSYIRANQNFDLIDGRLSAVKSGTAKISVKDTDWNDEVILNQPITLNTRAPRATFAVTKLSSDKDFVGKEQSSAVITVRNALDFDVRDLELVGKGSAAGLENYLDVSVDVDDLGQRVLLVSLKAQDDKGNELPAKFKKGSYTLDATFSLNKLKDQTAKVKVTILPIIIATATQKGSIDLVNRIGSSVTVTPNLRNVNGKVVGMTLADDGSNLFNVEWNSAKGAAIVTAKEEVDMKKGGRYKVTPIFQVETEGGIVEVTATRPINIVPKQSNLRFTRLDVMEARLSNTDIPARAVMKATSPANAEILEMVQTNNLDNFDVNYDFRSGALTVRIIDAAGLKAGSTYRITLEVNVKDSGVNVRPQRITVPVKVLN